MPAGPSLVDIERARTLRRYLADPKKVRVSMRFHEGVWTVFIFSRDPNAFPHAATRGFSASNVRPERALIDALAAAEGHIPGVDLSMGWSMPHPFGVPTDHDRDQEELQLIEDIAALLHGEYG